LGTIASRRKVEPPKLIHSVRGDLDWIVMKALEKDRTRRYETANGLAADIKRHLSNEAVLARPPSGLYRFQKLVRRNKLVFAAAAAIVAALTVGVACSVWALVKEHQARLGAEQVSQFLKDMLNSVGPSVALGRDTALLREVLDNTARRVGTDLAKQPEVEAELRYTLGEVYWELGDLEKAEAMHRAALSLRTKVFGNNSPPVAQSMRRLGHVLWRRGRLDEAETLARTGVAIQRGLFGDTNLEVARSLEDLAAILNTQGRSSKAEAALREALAAKKALLRHNDLELADTLDDLASFLFSRHLKVTEAGTLSRESLAIRQQLLGEDNPIVGIASLKIQVAELDVQHRPHEEEEALRKLAAAQRKLFGNEHPDLAQSLNLLATVLKSERKLAESEEVRREALSMQRKLLGRENPEVAQTLANLGDLLTEEKKLSEAETILVEALKMRRKVLGPASTLSAYSISALGRVLENEGKLDDARKLYLEFASDASVSGATSQYCLGLMYLHGQGVKQDAAEAAKWYRKSADSGNGHAQLDLAVMYFNGTGVARDEDEAVAWFNQAAAQGNAQAMLTLANSYCSVGHSTKALGVLASYCEAHPADADASFNLAIWQAWFGREADYDATRHRLVLKATGANQVIRMVKTASNGAGRVVQREEGTQQALTAADAAKAACLRPSPDTFLLTITLDLARRGVELRKGSAQMPWYQLTLGLAEFRNGQYQEAEQTLKVAEQTAGGFVNIPGIARLFRAMCLFQQNQPEEARTLFHQAQANMPPLPADERKPLANGQLAYPNLLLYWLALKEAKCMLE